MTRFTRAIGSKSSNKRVPDEATPWSQLKNPEANPPVTKQVVPVKIHWKKKQSDSDSIEISGPSVSSNSLELNENKKTYKRRKPLTDYAPIVKDGKEINVVRFEGFPVKKEDAERLKSLKVKLLASKIPHNEIKKTMKLERRRAEKALAREKKQICFQCRQSGHLLSQCPELRNNGEQSTESGICFKCGSTEHQHTQCKVVRGDNYKFATCFICKQEGHISKQCPDNPKGLYPEGGSCRICGDVTHLKKDCPKFCKRKKEEFEVTVNTLHPGALDALDEDLTSRSVSPPPIKKKKIIKM